ncbi:MAG: DMT family transporter [Pseudomonadota bacterium]
MELWIPLAIAAAFFQNLRSALQKRLRDRLSVWGATAARFVFAAPLALAACATALALRGPLPPAPGADFLAWSISGGLAQIGATALLVHLFSFRNFTVAGAFTKTEPIQTALIGVVLLGDRLSAPATLAILVSLTGVLLISTPPGRARGELLLDRNALIGIAAGGLFGYSAVAYRGATLALDSPDPVLRVVLAATFVTLFQAALMFAWLRWREPGQTTRLMAAARPAALVGLSGALATFGWYAAFSLETAAHVRAVGQIDVVFMVAASVLLFGERITMRELSGVALVVAGITALALTAG